MTKNYFIDLADYHVWANNIVCTWLDKISDEQWKQHIVSSFPGIYDTVLHLAASEKLWVERLKKFTKHELLTETFNGTKEELIKLWQESSLNFKKFIDDFPGDSLDEKLAFKNIKGVPHNQPYWQLFAHIINHTTYHRGQVVTMLRQVGFTELSSIDMTTYFRTKAPSNSP
jgi:uncharacterized damage-inducible protein DinB